MTIESEGTYNVTVSWNKTVDNAQGYYFELKPLNSSDVVGKNDSISNPNATSHTIIELNPGTEYSVGVAACTSCNNNSQIGDMCYADPPAKTSKYIQRGTFACTRLAANSLK